jgi:hypothetical protein
MSPLEASVVKSIERVLHRRRAWWFKTHGTGHGRSGIPDLVGAYRGRALALEVKPPGLVGSATRLQRHELDRAARAGAAAHIVTTPAEVDELLDKIDADLQEAS